MKKNPLVWFLTALIIGLILGLVFSYFFGVKILGGASISGTLDGSMVHKLG